MDRDVSQSVVYKPFPTPHRCQGERATEPTLSETVAFEDEDKALKKDFVCTKHG